MRTDLEARRISRPSFCPLHQRSGHTTLRSRRPTEHRRSRFYCLVIPSELFLPITSRSGPGCSSRFSPTHQGSSQPPQMTRSPSAVGVNRSRPVRRLSFISEVALQLLPVTLSLHAVCRWKLGKAGGWGWWGGWVCWSAGPEWKLFRVG